MIKIIRGSILDFTGDPAESPDKLRFYPDGGLAVENGYVKGLDDFESACKRFPEAETEDFSGKLILPGLIDTHIHFPQTEMIGSYGKRLLDWLDNYTFPTELQFADPSYSRKMAGCFIRELFRNGTTSCMAYATVYKHSADALFEAASSYDMRIFCGKVLMNRNAPQGLTDTVSRAEADCRELIARWHGKGRNTYVLTPRFAITSDREELDMTASLYREFPDTYIQTHLSENKAEVEQIHRLYPGSRDYLDVYEQSGLLTGRTVFAHGIHLSASELERISSAGAVIAHCPTSNLFLGSGLFDMQQANRNKVCTTIATDVGAGTSFSLFRTLGEAYKVQQLNGYSMRAPEAFYKITLGAAKALKADHLFGNFDEGKEADFIVVDYEVPTVQKLRTEHLKAAGKWTPENLLFGLQILADDRNITATYIKGRQVYLQTNAGNAIFG